ncbi:MAG: imidazole glycerol phosphate synthase subunit HisF [Desulfobulbaceae bacterium]|nr:imidazole glycerol phosphate synthase subunit HisF [Desulfobulbaceae bacterium]
MLKKRLIPKLLLKEGRTVKGVRFKDLRDVGNPITNARIYNAQGADELIFLDITASQEKRDILYDIISKTSEECFMPFTAGGGVRTLEDIRLLLRAGADKVSVNSAAVERPEFIRQAADRFGRQCVVGAVDYGLSYDGQYRVYTHGGKNEADFDPVSWCLKLQEMGVGELLLTSIDRDGTREGFDLKMTRKIADTVGVPVIASGGAGTLVDLAEGFVEGHAAALAVGSLFHFTDQSPIKAQFYLKGEGVDVRV